MTSNSSISGDSLLYAKDVADLLQIKLCTVYEMTRNGTLPCVRVGSRIVRFRRSSIEQWLADNESGGRDST
jgi:excisionase family DNA binding protein